MVKLTGSFSKLQKINALVVGDFILDKYTFGKVERISPEAPVSVLRADNEKILPGGAGNVALNLISMGASVFLLGRIGDDINSDIMLKLLKDNKANCSFFLQKDYKTPLKNRFIADNQQVLRVDFERVDELSKSVENAIIAKLKSILKNIDIIAVSDYAKGFLSDELLRSLLDHAAQKDIPTIVDPKGQDFTKYKKATVIKPNLKEAYLASNLNRSQNLDVVAAELLSQTQAKYLIITRSEAGISLFQQDKSKNLQSFHYPVVSKEVKDVTGAGDSVLATLSLAIANNFSMQEACVLSNIAASITIEHIGCKQITLKDFARRLLKVDTDNKIFDFSHLDALKTILEEQCFVIFAIKTSDEIPHIYKSLKKLKQDFQRIIIYILNDDCCDDFIELLSSLKEVDFILLKSSNLKNILNELKGSFSIYTLHNSSLEKYQNINCLLLKDI